MKKYYIDIDTKTIEQLINLDTSSLHKLEHNIIKYKKYITELLNNIDIKTGISSINHIIIDQCFTSNYYKKNIHKEDNRIETILFNRIGYLVEQGSNTKKKISAYKLNNYIVNYIINLDIEDIKIIPYEVKRKQKYITHYIEIDRTYIQSLIQDIELQIKNIEIPENPYIDLDIRTDEENKILDLKREIINYRMILIESKRNNKIRLDYDVKSAGRLYNQYSSLKKDIRNNILKGYHEYDISTASYQWLHDSAIQIKDIKIPTIKNYIDNKKKVRYKIAKELNTSYEVVKEIITALGFGAKADITDIELYNDETQELEAFIPNAIQKILTRNNIDIEKFQNSEIQNFIEETKKAMKIVSQYHKEKYYNNKTKILNLKNKKLYFNKKYTHGKALAFIYQIYESKFLLSMRDTYKQYTKDNNYFLLHDAIYTKKEIDITTLEQSKQTLEFKINWKLEKE